jgi:hypothetical protein
LIVALPIVVDIGAVFKINSLVLNSKCAIKLLSIFEPNNLISLLIIGSLNISVSL